MKLISARSSRAPGAEQHVEPRPGHARRPLEVDDAELDAEVPVRPAASKSNARGSPCRRTSTFSAALAPTGHALVRQVRQPQQHLAPLALQALERGVELLDLVGPPLVGVEQRRGVTPLLLQLCDLLAGLVAIALEVLHGRDQATSFRVHGRELVEQRIGGGPTRAKAFPDDIEAVTNEGGVEHPEYCTGVRRTTSCAAPDATPLRGPC